MLNKGYVKFLGTAGARFVMIKQLRSSGGLWVSYKDTNIIIDPGPGSLVRCLSSTPRLDPEDLDGIVLTHKHIDHSNDVNVMIEAMTGGGYKKKGILLAPEDCFGKGGVVFDYVQTFLDSVEHFKEVNFKIKDIRIEVPVKMLHSVQTYGLRLSLGEVKIGLITDTGFFQGLKKAYKGLDVLIINLVLYEKRGNLEHLCLEEVRDILAEVKPKRVILTHFGRGMLDKNPKEIEDSLNRDSFFKKAGIRIICAYDGLKVDF
jgi:phosphoribosyl 1,2-cyclic phosphodiesterase